MTTNRYFMLDKVTQSWPSPALCFVERVPQDAQSSHVTVFNSGDGSSKSDNESTSSKSMRDVHIVRTKIHSSMSEPISLNIKTVYFQICGTAGLMLYMINIIETLDYCRLFMFNKYSFCVFQSMRLMEDFLDLAKQNTEKDLETCGILGACLVRIIVKP